MISIAITPFLAGQPAARVDACLREALDACDRARQCAVLWFAEVQRRALYRDLGYASLQAYANDALGFSDNRFRQFRRLADELERLPALREAVVAGELGWTKAQQVARIAAPATQVAWIERAKSTGRRELERQVRDARARLQPRRAATGQLELGCGQLDGAAADATVDAAAADAAAADAARNDEAGAAGTGGEGNLAVLAAPPSPRAPAHAAGPRHTVSLQFDALQLARFEALVEQLRRKRAVPAHADRAEVVLAALAALAEGGGDGEALAAPAALRGAPPVQVVVQRCPDCAAAVVATGRGELPLAPAQVAALACDARVRIPGGRNRATIAPRLRAAVLARDRHRCASPGCAATRFLEVHHVVPRSAGGANELANLVTLCSRCHGFVHERHLRQDATAAGARGDGAIRR